MPCSPLGAVPCLVASECATSDNRAYGNQRAFTAARALPLLGPHSGYTGKKAPDIIVEQTSRDGLGSQGAYDERGA